MAGGRWGELSAFLSSAIAFYEAPGGITVRLLRDVQDPEAFVEVIEYESERAYAQDQRRVESDTEMLARLEAWHGLLEGPVHVQTLRDVTPDRSSSDQSSWEGSS